MAALTCFALGIAVGFLWGSAHREHRNQSEWTDYQAFLRQQRPRPRFEADRWGVSSGPPTVSPE